MATLNRKLSFANRLVQLRQERGISRQQLANDLEVSRASLEFYEKEQRKPDIEVLARIAEYFHVSTDYLLGFSDLRTMDAEQSMVCEYTGLSEETIQKLHERMEKKQLCDELNLLYPWMQNGMYRFVDAIVDCGMGGTFEDTLNRSIMISQAEEMVLPDLITELKNCIQEVQNFNGTDAEYQDWKEEIWGRYLDLTREYIGRTESQNAGYYTTQRLLTNVVEEISETELQRNLQKETDALVRSFEEVYESLERKYLEIVL